MVFDGDWVPIPESDLETVEVPETGCPIATSDLQRMECIYSKGVILASDCHTVDVYVNVKKLSLFQNMSVTVHLTYLHHSNHMLPA